MFKLLVPIGFSLALLSPHAIATGKVDLTSKMTPSKHQGDRGTCSAFAAVALIEFLIKQEFNQTLDLSEQYTYWATKEYTLTDSYRMAYATTDGNAGFMAVESLSYGSMLENEWPYEYYNWFQLNDSRCDKKNITKECFTGALPNDSKLLPYRVEPFYIDLEKVAEFIMTEKRPVVVNINWYFNSIGSKGDIRMPTPSDLKGPQGGHTIILVGYDPKTDRYIFKNSHGERFGRNGFGTVPKAYVEQYYEVKDSMGDINRYSPDVRDFLIKASKGVSAHLLK